MPGALIAAAVVCASPVVHDGDTIRCGRERVRMAIPATLIGMVPGSRASETCAGLHLLRNLLAVLQK